MFLVILSALLPPAVLWLYVWRKDSQRPEPWWQLLKSVGLGALACLPVAYLGRLAAGACLPDGVATGVVGVLLDSFAFKALPQECAKLLMLWIVVRKNPYYDEHFDGIVYAVSVGLGFAAMENLVSLLSRPDGWQVAAVARALLVVPGHYIFAVLMGYYYSLNHFVLRSRRNAAFVLLVPFLVHGCYNAVAGIGKVAPELYGIAFLALAFFCVRMHRVCHKRMMQLLDRDSDE